MKRMITPAQAARPSLAAARSSSCRRRTARCWPTCGATTSDTILCVANLSRSVQPVELDLSRFQGMIPVEMLGQTEFPRIGQQPYFLSLGAYAFTWFRLQPTAPSTTERTTPETTAAIPDVPPLFVGAVWDTLLDGSVRALIERDLLGPFLQRQPWFQGDRPKSVALQGLGSAPPRSGADLPDDCRSRARRSVRRARGDGLPPVFRSACTWIGREREADSGTRSPRGARTSHRGAERRDLRRVVRHALCRTPARSGRWNHGRGPAERSTAACTAPGARRASDAPATESDTPLALKLFRRVEPGVHPEIEITAHLAAAGFTRVPSIAATVDYARSDGSPSSIGMFTVDALPTVRRTAGRTRSTGWAGCSTR